VPRLVFNVFMSYCFALPHWDVARNAVGVRLSLETLKAPRGSLPQLKTSKRLCSQNSEIAILTAEMLTTSSNLRDTSLVASFVGASWRRTNGVKIITNDRVLRKIKRTRNL
jgi:hypothetical protein